MQLKVARRMKSTSSSLHAVADNANGRSATTSRCSSTDLPASHPPARHFARSTACTGTAASTEQRPSSHSASSTSSSPGQAGRDSLVQRRADRARPRVTSRPRQSPRRKRRRGTGGGEGAPGGLGTGDRAVAQPARTRSLTRCGRSCRAPNWSTTCRVPGPPPEASSARKSRRSCTEAAPRHRRRRLDGRRCRADREADALLGPARRLDARPALASRDGDRLPRHVIEELGLEKGSPTQPRWRSAATPRTAPESSWSPDLQHVPWTKPGLTSMQWRMLAQRCPSRSMTLVGDPAGQWPA